MSYWKCNKIIQKTTSMFILVKQASSLEFDGESHLKSTNMLPSKQYFIAITLIVDTFTISANQLYLSGNVASQCL